MHTLSADYKKLNFKTLLCFIGASRSVYLNLSQRRLKIKPLFICFLNIFQRDFEDA